MLSHYCHQWKQRCLREQLPSFRAHGHKERVERACHTVLVLEKKEKRSRIQKPRAGQARDATGRPGATMHTLPPAQLPSSCRGPRTPRTDTVVAEATEFSKLSSGPWKSTCPKTISINSWLLKWLVDLSVFITVGGPRLEKLISSLLLIVEV